MTRNLFGTDGIRGTVGASPFTHAEITAIGYALGTWLQKKYGHSPKVLIAHDTRQSCSFVNASLKSGLLLFPITLHDAGILPTPTVSYLVENNSEYDCGIIISASHNPYPDNGIKIIDKKTGKLSKEDELYISHLVHNKNNIPNYKNFGSDSTQPAIAQTYIEAIHNMFQQNFLNKLKIVLDCAHGATFQLAPTIFNYFGAETIVINNQPNGTNINNQCGALFTTHLQKTVIKHNASIGFAFDGDGDRVTIVNKNGEIKDGDDILALLLQHPLYKQEKSIVGTVMTNEGLAQFLQSNNKQLLRSAVGDKHVAQLIKKNSLLLGGEPSGHIIMQDHLNMGDGIVTALRILESIQETNNWNLQSFRRYPQKLINVPIKVKKDLSSPTLSQLINNYQDKLPHGRLITRYSGTENILRVMVEDKDGKHAQIICSQLSDALAKKINN